MTQLALALLLLASGAAALMYQVLWQRQLGLVLGNTAHAAAGALAVFFLGLALGNWWWGDRAARSPQPLRVYARLELGVAAGALLFAALVPLYRALYGPLDAVFGDTPLLFAVARLALAAVVLLPPAICMGGTLPMLAQHLVRRPEALGRVGSALLAVNTLGGALGALAAGIWLPPLFGMSRTLAVAIALNLGSAAIARGMSVRHATPPPAPAATPEGALPPRTLYAIAAVSGFAVLGLEVLWTRMFALVLHNSVYSFTLVLVTFLVALAGGAALAHALCRRGAAPRPTLFALLLAAGAGVAMTPFVFWWATDGLAYVAADAGWHAYLRAVAALVALTILPPAVLLGTVFPFLLAALRVEGGAGRAFGRLTAVNTAGGIVGALVCGFALLELIGLWGAINAVALLYFAAATLLAAAPLPAAVRPLPVAALLLFATLLDPSRLRVTRVAANEAVLAHWESAYGVTAVVQRASSRRIKLDNYYSLGGTGALTYERTQADLPLVLHRQPKSVFFLGLGTGITAGAALEHPVERLTAVELVPQVVDASRRYFGAWTNDLFSDARARVRVGDGRSLLLADRTPHDVVIADLFIPWQSGAGALYTREHFAAVRDTLAPGGLFAQWLPLYQLSRDEFLVIARTMLDVFPQVTLWRGDFLPDRPIVALVGQTDVAPLDPDAVVANFQRRQAGLAAPRATVLALTGLYYAGNLGENRDLFAGDVLNTDDRPVIEYSSPITQREQRGNAARWFVGEPLGTFLEDLAARLPTARDPYLARLRDRERDYVDAGRALFAARVATAAGRTADAERLTAAFAAAVPYEVFERFDGQPGS